MFEFSKGEGLTRKARPFETAGGVRTVPAEPELVETLDSLHSDANSVAHGQEFDDWASDLGYDSDSRTALRVYRAVLKNHHELRTFFGREVYAEFLQCEGE